MIIVFFLNIWVGVGLASVQKIPEKPWGPLLVSHFQSMKDDNDKIPLSMGGECRIQTEIKMKMNRCSAA